MTQQEKDILYAKADTLRYSIADPQLQATMSIVIDTILALPVDDKPPMGFTAKAKDDESGKD